MGGDIWQWTEGIMTAGYDRVLRGGSWYGDAAGLVSSIRGNNSPTSVEYYTGFRVAASVPEPSTITLLLASAACLVGLAWWQRSFRKILAGVLVIFSRFWEGALMCLARHTLRRSEFMYRRISVMALYLVHLVCWHSFQVRSAARLFSSLFSFNGANGNIPVGDLTVNGSTMYGITHSGGSSGAGVVFSIATNGMNFQSLFSLPSGLPHDGLALGGSTLYGTTWSGGTGGAGSIISINVDGTGFQTLHSFDRTTDGATARSPA